MGCRVIAAGQTLAVRPVFSDVRRAAEPKPFIPAPFQPAPEPELGLLRSRVAELELALQRETRNARESGRLEGEAAAREQARAEITPMLERLTRGITEMAALRARIRRESENDLVKLALAVARRIVRRELSVDPDAVHGVVRAALEKVHSKDLRRLRVHPEFEAPIRRHIEATGVISGTEIVADASLQPGDLIVETRLGDLDASVESQLSEIERGFADRLNR